MLDPKSGRTDVARKPIRLLSKQRLKDAWKKSRDSSTDAGRPGIDGQTALQFAANLDSNLHTLSKRLLSGAYGPSRLKSVFIPKENSNKERMICIPTVSDRLVQRTIVRYLVANRKLPIYNSSSFGFIDGLGPAAAIRRAIELRQDHGWLLKTDIETFFDSIPRPYLKKRVIETLGKSSLTPIILKIIDCEIQQNPKNQEKIRKQGIKLGTGVRQGMPLSPILANLVLSKFDQSIERHKLKMVRYADDLIICFPDRAAAERGHQIVKEILSQIGLKIPEIEDKSKTEFIAPRRPVTFLGREILYLDSKEKYVARIGEKQIDKIRAQVSKDYSYPIRSRNKSTLQETVVDLSQSISAYLGVYKDADNYDHFAKLLRGAMRETISKLFVEIFGANALSKLESHQKNFLGIGELDFPQPHNEFDTYL